MPRAWVYPRACGGTAFSAPPTSPPKGLSPRVRGNRQNLARITIIERSIPARAGEPLRCKRVSPPGEVYPRACGGTHRGGSSLQQRDGLSPRVRGNPSLNDARLAIGGSIPARAGEPCLCACPALRSIGLSPRVRGNQRVQLLTNPTYGSIPARAGEPIPAAAVSYSTTVYPRACGGTGRHIQRQVLGAGLSPRVRGNRSSLPIAAAAKSVYPRACGGTPWQIDSFYLPSFAKGM